MSVERKFRFVKFFQVDYKVIMPLSEDDFKRMLTKASTVVKKARLTKKDLEKEIKLFRLTRKKFINKKRCLREALNSINV